MTMEPKPESVDWDLIGKAEEDAQRLTKMLSGVAYLGSQAKVTASLKQALRDTEGKAKTAADEAAKAEKAAKERLGSLKADVELATTQLAVARKAEATAKASSAKLVDDAKAEASRLTSEARKTAADVKASAEAEAKVLVATATTEAAAIREKAATTLAGLERDISEAEVRKGRITGEVAKLRDRIGL